MEQEHLPNQKTSQFEIRELLVAMVMVFFVGLLVITFGLIGRGFESAQFMQSFMFYFGGLLVVGLGLVITLKLISLKNLDVFALIHDPEKALIPPKYNPFKNPIVFAIVSLILALIIGLWSVYSNTLFVGTTQLLFPLQQVSKVSNLIFGAEPAATCETFLFLGLMCLIITIFNLTIFKNARGWRKFIYIIIIPIAIGLIGVGYHQLRYSGQEAALVMVFLFWWLSAFVTLLFGSVIFMWIVHVVNNMLVSAKGLLYSNDNILIASIIIAAIVIIPSVFYLISKFTKRRRR